MGTRQRETHLNTKNTKRKESVETYLPALLEPQCRKRGQIAKRQLSETWTSEKHRLKEPQKRLHPLSKKMVWKCALNLSDNEVDGGGGARRWRQRELTWRVNFSDSQMINSPNCSKFIWYPKDKFTQLQNTKLLSSICLFRCWAPHT